MSTWLLQVGGAPVPEDQAFDAAPPEGTWALNDSWQYLSVFAAAAVAWANFDWIAPLGYQMAGEAPPIGGATPMLSLMKVG